MAKSRTRKRAAPVQNNSKAMPLIVAGVTVVIIIIGLVIFASSADTPTVEGVALEVDYPVGITEDGEPFKGGAEAAVVIEEYADFMCNHCGTFHLTLQEISDDYIKTGKVKIIFRNYAFLGLGSISAAQAGECALEQSPEAFWIFHDAVFANQSRGQSTFTRNGLKSIAEQTKLDTSAFNKCLTTNKMAGEVNQDRNDGEALGVDSTPTLFINGQQFGGIDAVQLRTVIEQLLAAQSE